MDMSLLMSEGVTHAEAGPQAAPVRFYARIGMAELLARVYYLKEIPRRRFFPVDDLDMPADPERFLGWLETDFCAMLLNGKISLTTRDSHRSYGFGCALLKGAGAVVEINAPLAGTADEVKRNVRVVLARRSVKREIDELIRSMQTDDDLCQLFDRYRIYPVGRTGRLWARRCGAQVEKRPRDTLRLVKMLVEVYPYFDVDLGAVGGAEEE
jgi:hypothetical protein